jgi:hypothetical protein
MNTIENRLDLDIWSMMKRVGLKPHEQDMVYVDVHHRPATVVAIVRNVHDKLPLGVGHARKNPNVTAEYTNLERLAIRRALDNALPLVRIL